VSQPGVKHIEAHFPQGTGVLIYDPGMASAEDLARVITQKTKYPTSVKLDRPLK
jgi:hypothetical protein